MTGDKITLGDILFLIKELIKAFLSTFWKFRILLVIGIIFIIIDVLLSELIFSLFNIEINLGDY